MWMLVQQCLKGVDVGTYVNMMVTSVCNINARDPRVHLLWARHGLEEIFGVRGIMFSVLSMYETANFSTNLDRKEMDISCSLRELFWKADLELCSNVCHVKTYTSEQCSCYEWLYSKLRAVSSKTC